MAKNKTSNDLTLDNFRRIFREEIKEELKPVNFRLGGLKEEIREIIKE